MDYQIVKIGNKDYCFDEIKWEYWPVDQPDNRTSLKVLPVVRIGRAYFYFDLDNWELREVGQPDNRNPLDNLEVIYPEFGFDFYFNIHTKKIVGSILDFKNTPFGCKRYYIPPVDHIDPIRYAVMQSLPLQNVIDGPLKYFFVAKERKNVKELHRKLKTFYQKQRRFKKKILDYKLKNRHK